MSYGLYSTGFKLDCWMEDLGSLKEYVYAWVPTTGDSDLTQIGASFNLLSIQRSPGNFGRRQWQLTLVLLPGKSHGQRSLVGYSP